MRFGYALSRNVDTTPITDAEVRELLGPQYDSFVQDARAKGVSTVYAVSVPNDYVRAER